MDTEGGFFISDEKRSSEMDRAEENNILDSLKYLRYN